MAAFYFVKFAFRLLFLLEIHINFVPKFIIYMDFSVIITAIAGLIATIGSSTVTWLLTRKKYNAEVDSARIDNLKKELDIYIKLCDDTKKRLDEVLEQKRKLEDDLLELKMQMADMYLVMNKSTKATRKKPTK